MGLVPISVFFFSLEKFGLKTKAKLKRLDNNATSPH